jgi:glucose-6-phosphate isomerase
MASLERLAELDAVKRLRQRDVTLFSEDIDQRIPIMQRLGWTDLAEKAPGRLPLLDGLAQAIVAEGATDLLLLGMGGSSLAPLVMERIIGTAPGYPRLHVLDTTSPVQVTELLDQLDREHTYAIVASKSGGTIEPLTLYAIVQAWLMADGMTRAEAGRRCMVITDPGSPLEKLRQRDLMRMTLSAPATVGGRYSALSMFGLAPAALMGIHVPALIQRAQAMETACGAPVNENPAALLAAWMADSWEAGRDKLTLVTSERFRPLGLWVEQLVAESLGKDGKGIVPVIECDPPAPEAYGADRAVVVVRFGDDATLADWSRAMADAHPVFELVVTDVFDLGAEFVRWEHAIALTGALMGVNPFDELAVTEAKTATNAILEGGSAEVPQARFDFDGTWVTFAGALATPESTPGDRVAALRTALMAAGAGDYLAFLVYAPDDDERLAPLRSACGAVSGATGRAVCFELGPRYLHSTGQLHKGGPNTGVFVLITARDRADLPVPGKRFTLGMLHRAQAEGDLVTLARHGRRVIRLDIPSTEPDVIAALADDLHAAL